MKNKKIVYISTSKLHRNRANLIQTLKTADAIHSIYNDFEIYMSPYKSKLPYINRLKELGISDEIVIQFSQFLHSRWKIFNYIPFIFLNRKKLHSSYIYVRSPRLSLALMKFKIYHMLELHDIVEEEFWQYIINGLKSGIILKIVTVSKILHDNLLEKGLNSNSISIIPNGVEYDSFSNISQINPKKLSSPTLVHIGSLSPSRGYNIIEGLAQKGYKIILAGYLDPSCKLTNNITYRGIVPHKDIPQIYEMGEIALIPYQPNLDSINSCCPIKLREAMAAGRIIIASDIKPVREAITHEKEGILVDPSDISSWVDAIQTIKKNPDLAINLSKRAKEKAMDFDWKKRANKIISLFKEKDDILS